MSELTSADSVASSKSKKKKNKKKAAIAAAIDSNGASEEQQQEEDAREQDEAEVESNAPEAPKSNGVEASERLDALARERDTLLEQVSGLRRSLEALQEKHAVEIGDIRVQLEKTQSGKEAAESKYEDLRDRVTTIRNTLGERLKEYSGEIAQQKSEIEELKDVNSDLRDANEKLTAELRSLHLQQSNHSRSIELLRGQANLSQQNWIKERDALIQREAMAREEFENAAQAMRNWEDLANEERLLRKNLEDRTGDLEDEIRMQRDAYERAAAERDSQSQTVENLQRALREIQEARKKELRDLVETSQGQLDDLRKQLEIVTDQAASSQAALKSTKAELETLQPLQQEIKEKNLLIGKLRHEAVTLNEHLTKALRFLKKSKPGDTVDRQLVTNHLLQFLAMERSDPKKFQVLQLIASLLGWSDEQKEQAGLARPGAISLSSLRVPASPFRRKSSVSSLGTQLDNTTSKESLAELWSDFLEREAQEGQSPKTSRRPSVASEVVLNQRDGDR